MVCQFGSTAAPTDMLFGNTQQRGCLDVMKQLGRHRIALDRQLGNGPQRRASGFGHRFEALEISAGERANGDYQRSVSIGKLSPGRVLRHRIISRMFAAPESDVRRRVRCGRPRYDGRDVFIEYGNERSDVRQAKQDAVVFYGVVRWSHHAVTISSTVSHKLYRKMVKRDIVSNLPER